MIKTFRGMLADGGQDRIRLQTIKGKVGYRIVKLQITSTLTGSIEAELVTKIYKDLQTTINGDVNFTDSNLLGMAYVKIHQTATTGSNEGGNTSNIIFDSEIFNQDIYVTAVDTHASNNTNYYIELEVIPLDDAGAEYTTLKDMRST